ncbi:MAG: hypothetical protein ACI9TH_004685 [Kiritimatiellia bacterium]|jgi:hypothetical protein
MIDIRKLPVIQLRGLGLLVCLLTSRSMAQTPAETRTITREWVTVEQAISREAAEAERTRVLLTDRIAVLEAERQRLQTAQATHATRTVEADREREALVLQEADASSVHAELSDFLLRTEGRVKQLRKRLPLSLSEKLAHRYQRIPADSASTDRGLAERLQTVMAILSNIQSFNDSITVVAEVKALGDQAEAEVTTVYIGLGQAYYLSARDAGYGYPGADAWTWISQPALKPAIKKAIATAEDRTANPGFISLPVALEQGP